MKTQRKYAHRVLRCSGFTFDLRVKEGQVEVSLRNAPEYISDLGAVGLDRLCRAWPDSDEIKRLLGIRVRFAPIYATMFESTYEVLS